MQGKKDQPRRGVMGFHMVPIYGSIWFHIPNPIRYTTVRGQKRAKESPEQGVTMLVTSWVGLDFHVDLPLHLSLAGVLSRHGTLLEGASSPIFT